jgi:hypothetical protein
MLQWEPQRQGAVPRSGQPIEEQAMPAKSKAQQRAAGAALSAKRGDTPMAKLKGPSKDMAESMTEKQLEELASTGRMGKPEHAGD